MKLETITSTELVLIGAFFSALLYKCGNYVVGSNCTKLSCCGFSCERVALSEDGALEILTQQTHVPEKAIHAMVIEELKDVEKG